MRPPHVLVTGCARSGTGYTAALLTRLGLACGHERVFAPQALRRAGGGRWDVAPAWPAHLPAESSWLAVPFLGVLPRGTLVVHQLRHPLAVMRSNLRIGFFTTPSDYLDFALAHAPGLAWGAPLERAARYWLEWNARIEREVAAHGLRCLSLRLEELDEHTLRALLAQVGVRVARGEVRAALADVPGDTNTRGRRAADVAVRVEDLPGDGLRAALQQAARRHGYADAAAPLPRGLLPESLTLF
jgi:hypothetical protein